MVEILANNIENLFENTDNRKYHSEDYDVWEVSDELYKTLCDMSDEEFEQKCPYGWWRSAEGSVLGTPDGEFEINGKSIFAYCGEARKNYYSECCQDCSDYTDKTCNAEYNDIEKCVGEKKYKNLLEYFYEELNISTEKNICAVCVDLAKYNNMTMAELFHKYQG